MTIHKTAVIEDGAQVHESAQIGPFAVIGPHVKIGAGTKVGAHAIIDGHTTIGGDCHIFAGASIGLEPQDLGYRDEPTGVIMGDRVTVREYVTIHRATKGGVTRVGNDCFIMNYAHIAHDCKIGDGVIMANGATLAGHVAVGDYAVLAGVCVVHQYVRLGRLIMVSGLSGTRVDMPPFTMCDGRPLRVRGINIIGMRRRKFGPDARSAIKEAYRLIYRSELNLSQALERVEKEIAPLPEIAEILDFYRTSKRGVVGRAPQSDPVED
jgi:UDP-N-acetylglucosamine acyltransferase